MAISVTSCSAHARGQAGSAAPRTIVSDSCACSSTRSARPFPGCCIGVRLSAFDLVPHRKGADGVGEIDPAGQRRAADWLRRHRGRRSSTPRSTTRARCFACSSRWASDGSASRPAVRTTARICSGPRSFRRWTATNRRTIRSAAWRVRFARPPCSKPTFPTSRSSAPAYSYLAGVAAARRAAQRATGTHGLRRTRARDAVISRPGGRRSSRRAAPPPVDLPHVQRLHDRPPNGIRIWLLPARSVLRRDAGIDPRP